MSRSYTKLFCSILESTVWAEDLATRAAWITMLAMADRHGRVWASVPGLANRARITIEQTEAALARFLAPDKYSRTPDFEGRRIEAIDGGWRLLNHAKYRELRDEEERREYKRAWDRENRPRRPTKADKSDKSRPRPTQAAPAPAPKAEKTTNPLSGDEAPDDVHAGKKASQLAREAGTRAIEYLNAKAGTRFRAVEANLKLPAARILYDGASEDDLRAVVDLKVAEAARGEFDRKYLRPATLWSAEKFSQYAGQISIGRAPAAPVHVRVYADRGDGSDRELVTEYESSGSSAEAAARRVLVTHGRRFDEARARNIVLDNGRESHTFALSELRAAA